MSLFAILLSNYATSLLSEDISKRFPETPLTILQYRPAWLEQLVLRIAGIPHVVVNVAYASHESTGPLPALRDMQTSDKSNNPSFDPGSTNETIIPILVGRRQPKMKMNAKEGTFAVKGFPTSTAINNSILEYLNQHKAVDLDTKLTEDGDDDMTAKSKETLSKLLKLLVTTKLQKCLMILRYEDANAWDQVYRKQCLQSSKLSTDASIITTLNTNKPYQNNISNYLPTMRGLYQSWSERVMARKELRLGNGNKEICLEEAKVEARKAYEIFEQQLTQVEHSGPSHCYLLGTKEPTMVDALLWAHLAEALCDVNLVVVLADFPHLVKFFQRIYDTFFPDSKARADNGGDYDAAVASRIRDSSWNIWNKHQNQANHFQQIPLEPGMIKEKARDSKKIKHALELMQSLSVQDHNLLEVLKVGKETRALEVAAKTRAMQGKAESPAVGATGVKKEPESSALEKARRQQQRHDQYWISLVTGVAILGGLSTLARMATDEE